MYFGNTVDGDGNDIRVYKRINPVIMSIKQVAKVEGITEKEAYKNMEQKYFKQQMHRHQLEQGLWIIATNKRFLKTCSQSNRTYWDYTPYMKNVNKEAGVDFSNGKKPSFFWAMALGFLSTLHQQ